MSSSLCGTKSDRAAAGAPALPRLAAKAGSARFAVEPGLTPAARTMLVAGLLAAHLGAAWALWQVQALRKPAADVAPLFVSLVAPPAEPEPEPPAPKNVQRREPPKPRLGPIPHLPSPVPTAVPEAVPTAITYVAPPDRIASQPEAPSAPEAVVQTPAPRPGAAVAHRAPVPPEPRVVPLAEVRYLVPPAPVYPAASRRLGEAGEVHLRVEIGVDGHARHVSVQRSSGFARLDESARTAVRAARFAPFVDHGLALVVWTTVPVVFELSD